jgi:hypothetical protein
MSKKIRDEKNGLEYERSGDYYLPKLEAPESPKIGRYGRLHLRWLRDSKDGIYTGLLLSGKLNSYLEELDASADQVLKDFFCTVSLKVRLIHG